jgi:membrane-bound lytic murein transglycosylase B
LSPARKNPPPPTPSRRPCRNAPAVTAGGAADDNLDIQPTQTFAEWQAGFRKDALQAGIRAELFDRAFAGVTPTSVIKADRSQPEFTRPVWEYLDGALSPLRVRNGQALLSRTPTC